ncbi:NAD(P)-dependent oxidoreductase [Pseudophaeobacter sp.]|uniref:NAD(P)-dependent oxidoreductase n=1 Tax=Pseudophaeobacter sp. TaxID=1971739 RepID=UPI00329A135D
MRISNISWTAHQEIKSIHELPASGEGGNLPALTELVKTENKPGRVRSILVAHVLHTAIEYVELVNSIYPVMKVVAVPYSADPTAVKSLRDRGFEVVVPESVEDTFVQSRDAVLAALSDSSEPLIAQEVGGYLAKFTDELTAHDHFIGIVEDTNNGHWRYEQHEPHRCPVLSMAQSPLKDVEDTIIGDAVVYSIERVFRENYSSVLQGARCGVIGFGKIGTSSAIALKGREGVVSVYDINPSKNMRAKVEGFFPLPLQELLTQTDVVIGATGQTSVRLVDMPYIKDGAILVSASSKRVEFALDEFKKACASVDALDEVSTRYLRKDGTSFIVLNDGTPINFRDKSILGTILDMIYCELFVCMREVANGRAKASLHHSPPPLQDEVAKAWLRHHSPAFQKLPNDKVWDYPKSLELGRPK